MECLKNNDLSVITYTGGIMRKMLYFGMGNTVYNSKEYLPKFSTWIFMSSSVAGERE